jgi:DNA helicase-2/ATP-dependent DNA helicase PcrA
MPSIAILARTNKALRPMEDALSTAGVKYRLLGKCGFWAQPEIRSIVAYLACAQFPSDFAVGTALRAPFWPSKYVKKTELAAKIKAKPEGELAINFLHRLSDDAVQKFVHFLDTLKRYRDLPAKDATAKILDELHVFEHYSEYGGDPDNDPTDNLKELGKIAARYSSLKEFLDYTRRATNSSKSKKAVILSTIHGAKGLEFDTVYLIQCNEGVLPHAKAESIEEESCVFFVACSRPERVLNISYTGQPSRFLLPFLKEEKRLVETIG